MYPIRKMYNKDLAAAVVIMKKSFLASSSRQGFLTMLKGRDIFCRVAVSDKDIAVGVIAYLVTKDWSRILILAIAEEYQKRGIGRSLVNYAENHTPRKKHITAAVPESLLPTGCQFVAHLGYHSMGLETSSKPGEIDLVIMGKMLVPAVEKTNTKELVS